MTKQDKQPHLCYKLSIDDFVAFWEYMYATSPTIRRQLRVLQAIGVIFLIVASCAWFADFSARDAIAAQFTAVVFTIFVTILHKRTFIKSNRKILAEGENKSLLSEQSMTLSDDGIVAASSVSDGTVKWAGIERLVTTESHTFIFVAAINAIVISRDAIIDGDYDSFVAELQSRYKLAR